MPVDKPFEDIVNIFPCITFSLIDEHYYWSIPPIGQLTLSQRPCCMTIECIE